MSEHDTHSEQPLPADAPAEMPMPRLPKPPFWAVGIGIVAVVLSWLPLAMSALGRTTKGSHPRIQLMQDMGMQPKFREQQTNDLFADGRAMRPAIAGTVAWGSGTSWDQVEANEQYSHGFHMVHNDATGKDEAVFYRGFPSQVKLTSDLLKRGQQRFNIYCSVCHGVDGSGHGQINERASDLVIQGTPGMTWVQPSVLVTWPVAGREEGNIFNTITNGARNMPAYGNQIPVDDRWAIVAYVRALQFSRNAPRSALTPEQLNELPK
jgi:mono/diheme cytochrome c family protein